MCRESSVGNEPAALRSNRHQCGYFFFSLSIPSSYRYYDFISRWRAFVFFFFHVVDQVMGATMHRMWPRHRSRKIRDGWEKTFSRFPKCLSVCVWDECNILSLFLSTYIYMPPYVQHSICNREKGSTFSERERHKQQAGGEEGKWITFEEPQNGPLLTYSNVSNRERKKWKEKKKISVRHELATISSREGDGRTVRLKGGRSAPLAGLNPHPARALFFPVRAKWWNSNFVFHQWPGR